MPSWAVVRTARAVARIAVAVAARTEVAARRVAARIVVAGRAAILRIAVSEHALVAVGCLEAEMRRRTMEARSR